MTRAANGMTRSATSVGQTESSHRYVSR